MHDPSLVTVKEDVWVVFAGQVTAWPSGVTDTA